MHFLFFWRKSKPQDTTPLIFTWIVTIEHGTIRESCAIDAGLTLQSTDRDMYTYSTNDTHAWVEYQKFLLANKRAIHKEEITDRYSY